MLLRSWTINFGRSTPRLSLISGNLALAFYGCPNLPGDLWSHPKPARQASQPKRAPSLSRDRLICLHPRPRPGNKRVRSHPSNCNFFEPNILGSAHRRAVGRRCKQHSSNQRSPRLRWRSGKPNLVSFRCS
jgi:hypothetical protein